MSFQTFSRSLSQPRRLVPLTLLIVGVGWFLSGQSFETGRQWLEASRGFGPLGFVGMGTFLMCFFVPKTFISLAAGGLFGLLDGAWILSTTALVSAMVNYHIGLWSLANRGRDREIPVGEDAEQQRLLSQIAGTAREAGTIFHVMVRLSPLPTTVISYTMGAARARRVPYAVAAVLASAPQWAWVYCGATATSGDEITMAQILGVSSSIIAALVLSLWIPRRILRVWKTPLEGGVGA